MLPLSSYVWFVMLEAASSGCALLADASSACLHTFDRAPQCIVLLRLPFMQCDCIAIDSRTHGSCVCLPRSYLKIIRLQTDFS